MLDYKTIDKTGWFVQQMRSGWFSRQEIVELAAKEFPSTSVKTLDGTIGRYWADSVNPKWGTYKAIQARGLKVVEKNGRRSLVLGNETSAFHGTDTTESIVDAVATRVRPVGHTEGEGNATRELWNGNDPNLWKKALKRYWEFVKSSNLALEMEMDHLDIGAIRAMDPQTWYRFLLEKYFRWKYTAPNRYASTTKVLRTYAANNELSALHAIKERLFVANKDNIQQCLALATSIRGLGTAGASGLLAVLFPEHFGTVDQFAVKTLAMVPELPEKGLIATMNPESLSPKEGVVLIRIMRRKADELNSALSTTEWTPRKVDMVLWTCGRP
jgi:hypothetical protein